MVESDADIAEGVSALIRQEPRFAAAVAVCETIPLRRSPPGFASLLKIVVGQQVSVAAAGRIWSRIEDAGAAARETVLTMSVDDLRALGLSRPKARYAKAIAQACDRGVLRLDHCAALPVDEAMAHLTAIEGIGPWTAQVYLMVCVGHADVFPAKDLALQESARLLFDLGERPTATALADMAKAWSPWRAVAARVLWAHYRAAKGGDGIVA